MLGSHCIKSWTITQSVISLSSGEAEYYAMVKGAAVSMGISSMLKEIGISVELELKCDASAAVGMVKRRGLGKVRHIDVSQLWLQEKVADNVLRITKVNTKENLSDGMTKPISGSEILWLLDQISQEVRDKGGR